MEIQNEIRQDITVVDDLCLDCVASCIDFDRLSEPDAQINEWDGLGHTVGGSMTNSILS